MAFRHQVLPGTPGFDRPDRKVSSLANNSGNQRSETFRGYGQCDSGAQVITQAWCFQTMFKLCQKLILVSALIRRSAPPRLDWIDRPRFTINDQYDHELQLSSARQASTADLRRSPGSDYIGAYATAVQESPVASSVTVIRIANLHAVPALMCSYVKRQFLKPNSEGKAKSPVLLDWTAALAAVYGFTDDLTNVYLIDQTESCATRPAARERPKIPAGCWT